MTLSFSPGGVDVVGATPNEGFTVDTEPEHGNGVKVEFESDGHESRVDAWWDGGPQVERRENGEDVRRQPRPRRRGRRRRRWRGPGLNAPADLFAGPPKT